MNLFGFIGDLREILASPPSGGLVGGLKGPPAQSIPRRGPIPAAVALGAYYGSFADKTGEYLGRFAYNASGLGPVNWVARNTGNAFWRYLQTLTPELSGHESESRLPTFFGLKPMRTYVAHWVLNPIGTAQAYIHNQTILFCVGTARGAIGRVDRAEWQNLGGGDVRSSAHQSFVGLLEESGTAFNSRTGQVERVDTVYYDSGRQLARPIKINEEIDQWVAGTRHKPLKDQSGRIVSWQYKGYGKSLHPAVREKLEEYYLPALQKRIEDLRLGQSAGRLSPDETNNLRRLEEAQRIILKKFRMEKFIGGIYDGWGLFNDFFSGRCFRSRFFFGGVVGGEHFYKQAQTARFGWQRRLYSWLYDHATLKLETRIKTPIRGPSGERLSIKEARRLGRQRSEVFFGRAKARLGRTLPGRVVGAIWQAPRSALGAVGSLARNLVSWAGRQALVIGSGLISSLFSGLGGGVAVGGVAAGGAAAAGAVTAPVWLVALIIILIVVLLLGILMIVVIIIPGAFKPYQGGIDEPSVAVGVIKTVELPSGLTRLPSDGNKYKVKYKVEVENNSEDKNLSEVQLKDDRSGTNCNYAAVIGAKQKALVCEFEYEIETRSGVDEWFTNIVSGKARLGGEEITLSGSVSLPIGNPSQEKPCGWPASGTIAQLFDNPNPRNWGGKHKGLDIGGGKLPRFDQPVYSTLAGTIYQAYWRSDACFGDIIVKSDDNSYSVRFLHLDEVAIGNWQGKIGKPVALGEFLGKTKKHLRDTGCTTGTHLHYEVREGISEDLNIRRDPQDYTGDTRKGVGTTVRAGGCFTP